MSEILFVECINCAELSVKVSGFFVIFWEDVVFCKYANTHIARPAITYKKSLKLLGKPRNGIRAIMAPRIINIFLLDIRLLYHPRYDNHKLPFLLFFIVCKVG